MTQPANRRILTEDRATLLAQAGQTPSQAPVPAGVTAVGTLNIAARADHVHSSGGSLAVWGSGLDGDLNFDGTSTVTLAQGAFDVITITPSAGVYTISHPIAAKNLTLGSGAVLALAQGVTLRVSDTLSCPTGSAVIHADGPAGAANGTAGAARASLFAPSPGAGGAGNTAAGTAGGPISGVFDQYASANGAGGGAGSSGAGGGPQGGNLNSSGVRHLLGRDLMVAFEGLFRQGGVANGVPQALTGAGGGGGGGGDGTNKGGGGGAGAGICIVTARKIVGNITIRAKGGAGGTPTTGNCGGGGGGGGGFVFINTSDASGYTGPSATPANLAPGGAGGSAVGTGVAGTNGPAGLVVMATWK